MNESMSAPCQFVSNRVVSRVAFSLLALVDWLINQLKISGDCCSEPYG